MKREQQKIILVTGKGGVGKTTVAAALALAQARAGKKVLLAEMGEKSFLHFIFPAFGGDAPVEATENLWLCRWEGEACLREYLLHYLKLERVVNLFFDNRVMKALIGAAPALRELALMGKITSGPRGIGPDLPYDVIVVDAYSTGHFKALIQAPLGMAEAIRMGPMGEQSRLITEVLRDSQRTETVIVTLPEELPINEALELDQYLANEMKMSARFVLNKNLPMPLSADEMTETRKKLLALENRPAGALEFLDYLEDVGQRQDQFSKELKGRHRTVVELPLYFQNTWPELLRAMCHDLEMTWSAG